MEPRRWPRVSPSPPSAAELSRLSLMFSFGAVKGLLLARLRGIAVGAEEALTVEMN